MSGDGRTPPPPPVMWAQRKYNILLSICLEDCKKPEIKFNNDSVYFKGIGGTDKKEYEVTINLYKEIVPEKSIYTVRDRIIECVLAKKEDGPFWPQLTKEKVKYHWLKVDFNKWEEEQDEFDRQDLNMPDDLSFEDMISKIGDQGSGAEGKANFDDLVESDSDDGDLPDLV